MTADMSNARNTPAASSDIAMTDDVAHLCEQLKQLNMQYIAAAKQCLNDADTASHTLIKHELFKFKDIIDTELVSATTRTKDDPIDVFREWSTLKKVPFSEADKYISQLKNKTISRSAMKGLFTKMHKVFTKQ
jgi:hypothetical protein